jgi:hypothetical protein
MTVKSVLIAALLRHVVMPVLMIVVSVAKAVQPYLVLTTVLTAHHAPLMMLRVLLTMHRVQNRVNHVLTMLRHATLIVMHHVAKISKPLVRNHNHAALKMLHIALSQIALVALLALKVLIVQRVTLVLVMAAIVTPLLVAINNHVVLQRVMTVTLLTNLNVAAKAKANLTSHVALHKSGYVANHNVSVSLLT